MFGALVYYICLLYVAFVVPYKQEKKYYKSLAIKNRDDAIAASIKGNVLETENKIRAMFDNFCRRGLDLHCIDMNPAKVHTLRITALKNSKKYCLIKQLIYFLDHKVV